MSARGGLRARLLAALLALPALALVELGLRAAGFRYPPLPPLVVWNAQEDADLLDATALHRIDPATLWSPRPGARVPWGAEERVSPGGYRGRDPDPAAAPRVVVLGDSTTFGYGVRERETYAARLEALLAPAWPRAQVVNAGLVGATIEQGWRRYLALCERWRPDVVVLAFGAVNEHWASSGLDDAAKLAELARRGGAAVAPEWSARLREELRLAHLAAWLGDLARGGRRAILERRAGASARAHEVGVYLEPGYLRRVSPGQFEQALERFRAATAEQGSALVLLHVPRPAETERARPPVLDYDPRLLAFAARSGTPLVEAHDAFRDGSAPEAELFVDPYHPSALGHERLARLLLPRVQECLAAGAQSEK